MSVNEHREEVQRVLHSTQFRRAPKLQRFLSLICEYHFKNRSHEINEYVIALEAFGKGADFDASQDSLVRVQAREARRRLHEYYQDEGKGSQVILDIPLGSYAPAFSAPVNPPSPKRLPMPRAGWIMLAATGLVCAVLLFSADRQRRLWLGASAQAASGPMSPLVSRLWSRFLDSETATVLVLSNPDVGECADTPPAADKGTDSSAVKKTRCPDEYTGMGEAVAINLFTNIFQARKKTLIVKQSRMVNEDDVRRYNLILLGGKKVNTWTARLGTDLKLAPDAGEVTLARPAAESTPKFETAFDAKTGQLISDRGLIALRRHPTTGHWLLFLYGKHTQGTLAAAEGSTQERFLAQLPWAKSPPVPDGFRVLLAVAVSNGIPEGPVPIAVRAP